MGAAVVIVGATIICPPAGLTLGAVYGGAEIGIAVSGKDWITGRELATNERLFRGLLAPLEIIPGVSGITRFAHTARLARVNDNTAPLSLLKRLQPYQHVGTVEGLLKNASQFSSARLHQLRQGWNDAKIIVKKKLTNDIIEVRTTVNTGITKTRQMFQLPEREFTF